MCCNLRSSRSFTVDRPRKLLLREEYYNDFQHQPNLYRRKFDYLRDDDFDDERAWHWNMSHQQAPRFYNGSSAVSSSSHRSKRNASDRSSGFQSFFRWFKKDEKNRNFKDIHFPREVTSSTDTLEYYDALKNPPVPQFRNKLRKNNRQSPLPSSPRISYGFSPSSSCDSIFSTASSFAFVPPIKYLLNRNQRQSEKVIIDNPYTESYNKRIRARDHMRESDRTNEVTLRKKYHLYAESSDTEANNNNISYIPDNNRPSTSKNNEIYQDLSLPNVVTKRESNKPDSVKLEDLNARQHRRTSSDSAKDRKAGSFVHVKNKKKAPPPPPLDLSKAIPKTLSGRRRKRQAPLPPPTDIAASATSLLGDKEIQALINKSSQQGTASLFKNSTTVSSPIVLSIESPIMEKKKIYVSPYLKIREDRKLTDEQKRTLLEQVTKSHRKSEEMIVNLNQQPSEKGQLNFPIAAVEKLSKENKEKIFAPHSPISPRPWYKRSSSYNPKETISRKEVHVKTIDKKKKKDEKDLPEVGYSRNSFFDTASKFNIFSKLADDSKKKDADKRKSLIGIPNISELDREAAEIIRNGQEAKAKLNESEIYIIGNESPKAKDLIHNKINSMNSELGGRKEVFAENEFSFNAKNVQELTTKPPSSPPVKPKVPKIEVKKSPPCDGLLGLWICNHCKIENANWKIICENCGKIKPYEKRFCVNGDAKKVESPLAARKVDKIPEGLAWEKKSEIVKKYFQPQLSTKPMDLSKSSSETFIAKSLSKKSPSPPTRRFGGSPKLFPKKSSIEKPDEQKIEVVKKEEKNVKLNSINDHEKKLTPDLDELRTARLARFRTSLDMKRNQSEIERQNGIATNRKSSPEKKLLGKLDFSDPVALERERERLRDKIRAMNAKALAEKFPVVIEEKNGEKSQENTQPCAPKLGAIKKVPKKPLEIVESSEEEKIINQDVKVASKKSEDFSLLLPITVVELTNNEKPGLVEEKKLAKTTYNANTMAINKILRNLENAIADGKHDEAAKLAKDLAKLKVPLSVTRQKDRPLSEIDLKLSKLKTWLCIKEEYREMEVNCYEISPQITIGELKKQIEKEYYIPAPKQKISINGQNYDNGTAVIKDLEFSNSDDIRIYVSTKSKEQDGAYKNESESDDESQNEKVGCVKTNIEDEGWECPLCTLINRPSRNECLACSTYKPKSIKDPSKLKEIEYHLKVKEDLRTFFDMDKVDLRIKEIGNDLDRNSGNRKSSDIFNILVEDKEIVQTLNPIVLTAALPSPNITKNKYRGVENFNPFNKSYLFPKKDATNDIRKPIITNVIYKSIYQNNSAKETSAQKRRSHYQELINIDVSDIVPNLEKFECSVCFEEIHELLGACLRECLHSFCRPCLSNLIKYCEDAEVKCPFINEIYSCQSLLQEREIRGLVSKNEYEKHLARSIQQAESKIENAFHCKTPNCKGWCIFEDTNSFKCPVCLITNCINCRSIHEGLNCKEYQDHLNMDSDADSIAQTKKFLQDLIDKNEAMNCPTCHIFVLKKWGCDWLKCSFCRTEICWVTKQARWGPAGKGDYSGGCRCGLNGKKCSPKCTYCH